MGRPRSARASSSLVLAAAAAIGAFAFAHDFGGIAIAIPDIQDHFSVGLGTVQWNATVFSIAIGVAVVPAGAWPTSTERGRCSS